MLLDVIKLFFIFYLSPSSQPIVVVVNFDLNLVNSQKIAALVANFDWIDSLHDWAVNIPIVPLIDKFLLAL